MTTSLNLLFPSFNDLSGQPLNSGFIYVGEANQDPMTHLIAIFFDAACTVSAPNPLRTAGGYIIDGNGAPQNIYVAGSVDFSVAVHDSANSELYTAASYPARFLSSAITFGSATVTTSITSAAAGVAVSGTNALPWLSSVARTLRGKIVEVFSTTQPATSSDYAKIMQNRLPLMIARQTSTNPAVLVNIYNCQSITRTGVGLYTVVPIVALPAAYGIWFQASDSTGTVSLQLTSRTTASFVVEAYVAGVAADLPFDFHIYGAPAVADPIS